MPFVLKHKQDAVIYTCVQMNKYEIPYYGVLHAVTVEQLEESAEQRLGSTQDDWAILEVEEMQIKMWNVRLRNDENLRLVLNEDRSATILPS